VREHNKYERNRKHQLVRQHLEDSCSNQWAKRDHHHRVRKSVNTQLHTALLQDPEDLDIHSVDIHQNRGGWGYRAYVSYGLDPRGNQALPRTWEIKKLPQWMQHRVHNNIKDDLDRRGLYPKSSRWIRRQIPTRIDLSDRLIGSTDGTEVLPLYRTYRSYHQQKEAEIKLVMDNAQFLLEWVCRHSRLEELNAKIRQEHQQKIRVTGYERVLLPSQKYLDGRWTDVLVPHMQELSYPVGPGPRVLKNIEDIPKFLRDLQRAASRNPYAGTYWSLYHKDHYGGRYIYWPHRAKHQNPNSHPEWLTTVQNYLLELTS
jgi:hypothetical protein